MRVLLLLLAVSICYGQTAIQQNYDSRAYQFTRTNGAGASGNLSAAGAKTVTVTPCPKAVPTSVYISGGTGAAEAVPVTGGTCTAGAVTGTLAFTTTQTHTGAWAITEATGGINGAAATAPAGSTVIVPASVTVYAPITIPKPLTLKCTSTGIVLTASGSPASVITVAADNVTIQGCTIAAGTATTAITNSGSHTRINIEGNKVTGSSSSIYLTAGSDISITRNSVSGFLANGITAFSLTPTDIVKVRITDNFVDSTSATSVTSAGISTWGNHTVIASNVLYAGTSIGAGLLGDQAIWAGSSVGAGMTDVTITGNAIYINAPNAINCVAIASLDSYTVTGNTCVVKATLATTGFNAYELNRSSRGILSGNVFTGNNPTVPTSPIVAESPYATVISNNTITGYGGNATSNGIGIVHTGTNPFGNSMSDNVISGNTIVQSVASATVAEIRWETLTTGTVANNVISNNVISGTTQAGHKCIFASNSGAATMTNLRITGNTLNTCHTGIEMTTGTLHAIDNNHLTNVTTAYVDGGTATRLLDFGGVPFSLLSTQANGSEVFCTDCKVTSGADNTCVGTGSGAKAVRLDGAWRCFASQN
jgi:fibronectin-binding autotransporter adhesin